MKIAAAFAAALVVAIAVLVWGLAPGVAGAQSVLDAPSNLTATPDAGAVHLSWTVPANAEYHFVAWLPVGAPAGDAQILPADVSGDATIPGLTPGQAYRFTVIASRWEWSPADFGPKWSAWSAFATATPLAAAPTPTPTPTPASRPNLPDSFESSSTSANIAVRLELTIGNLPMDLASGSSIVLYLEDDFIAPDTISPDSVYIAAVNPRTYATSNGGRVYATNPIEIDTDGYFTAGREDYAIRVFIPDMNTEVGFDGPMMGQTLNLVFTEAAGIRNPSEEGTHSVGYALLGPNDEPGDEPEVQLGTVATYAKISLSDDSNVRGYQLTVTGSGFNNGTAAALHVLTDTDTTADLAAMVAAGGEQEAQACGIILREGHRLGVATVGSDDRVSITVDVTVPIFKPGNVNYICMVDGEGRASLTDVEVFELEPTLRASPSAANLGDTINLFAQDFPNPGAGFTSLRVAGQEVVNTVWANPGGNQVRVTASSVGSDGSATATFALPGSVSGTPLAGRVRIDAAWGDVRENTYVTVTGGPTLRLQAYRDIIAISEARANESIMLLGEGFGVGSDNYIDPANITIDGVPLLVADNSLTDDGKVEVSGAGQFVALVHLWADSDYSNPALVPGTRTIGVWDNRGFYGAAAIVIKEPTLAVAPAMAAPGDSVTITGADWPVDNYDSDARLNNVEVEVENRLYSVLPDANGSFTVQHRLSRNIGIPSTQQVRAIYGSGEIVKVASFEVPAATIAITPDAGKAGDQVRLSVAGMPPNTRVVSITIGGAEVLDAQELRTDGEGAVTATVAIPGLRPGTYSVVVKVGAAANQTVAIGALRVLP